MKINSILILLIGFLTACGGSQESAEQTGEQPEEAATEQRYSYTDEFETGDPADLKVVKDWTNAFLEGNLDAAFDLLADSVYLILADGTEVNAPKDSIESMISNMIAGIPSMEVHFLAAIPTRSTPDGNNWVGSYTWEKYSSADGDVNALFHEIYGIENGKIRSVYQYSQAPSELDAIGEKQYGDYQYSGTWESMGEKNTDAFNDFVDLFLNQNVEAGKKYWTDSVTVIFSDGNYFRGTSDSLMVRISDYSRNAKDTDPVAMASVRSVPQDDEWILSWYTTTVDGQRIAVHEAWLVEDGKFSFIRQFTRPVLE